MKYNELQKLFADDKLLPSRKFESTLRDQVLTARKNTRRYPIFIKLGSVFAAALLLIGVGLLRPFEKQLSDTVLLKDLYARAFAAELPSADSTNSWYIDTISTYGSQAPICHNQPAGSSYTTKNFIYDDGERSASIYVSPFILPEETQQYSEDQNRPAYDKSIFAGVNSSYVQSMIVDAKLSDQNGIELPDNATIPKQTSGVYSFYASIQTPPSDTKNYLEDCHSLRISIEIDAATEHVSRITLYNTTKNNIISDINIIVRIESNLKMLDQTLEEYVTAVSSYGFNLAEAQAKTSAIQTIQLDNIPAGYSTIVDTSIFGELELTELRNTNNKISGYSYSSTKYPSMKYIFYTKEAESVPDLRTLATAKNMKIALDVAENNLVSRDYGTYTLELFIAEDDTTTYGLSKTGSTDIPYIYFEGPKTIREEAMNRASIDQPFIDPIEPLLRAVVFTPNGTNPASQAL